MMQALIDIVLLGFLAVIALVAVRLRDLFGVVMLFGLYSLMCATLFMVLDAVDVAFTEAAVGAGVSTVLMLSTLAPFTVTHRGNYGRRACLRHLGHTAVRRSGCAHPSACGAALFSRVRQRDRHPECRYVSARELPRV